VSELLRERLGPTSEYVQSLISIQAAYINTNHPDFVKGSAAAAQESARVQRERRVLAADAASAGALGGGGAGGAGGGARGSDRRRSGAVTEAEDGEASGGAGAKGRAASSGHHARPSFSSSGYPQQQQPQQGASSSTRQQYSYPQQGGQYSQQHGSSSPMPVVLGGNAGAHHDRHASSAKESFLTYFFGGNPVGSVGGLAGGSHGGGGDMAHAHAATRGGAEFGQANPLSGRKGLEGNAAAFEMKSLDKHLEPVRPPLSHSPSPSGTSTDFGARTLAVTVEQHGRAAADGPRGARDEPDPGAHRELLQHRAPHDSGPRAQGHHACVLAPLPRARRSVPS